MSKPRRKPVADRVLAEQRAAGVLVRVRCVMCKRERAITPSREEPVCSHDFMPMVPVKSEVREILQKRRGR